MEEMEFLKYSFAQDGDKENVPMETSPDGKVSIQQGYPVDYSRNPSAGGKYIERQGFNYIMNLAYKCVRLIQLNGLNLFNNTISSTIGYPKGARCAVWIDISTGQLNRNGKDDPKCITIPIVSMQDANKSNPYDAGMINKDWWLDDGLQIGAVKTFQVNLSQAPSGYLPLGNSAEQPSYAKADYPRIKTLLGTSTSSTHGFFKSTSADNFTIINTRGRVGREWSNGSTIDSGRNFTDLQQDAIREIIAKWKYVVDKRGGNYVYCFGETSDNKLPWQVEGSAESLLINLGSEGKTGDYYNVRGLSTNWAAGLGFRASKSVPTADENRMSNYCFRAYIKV